MKTIRHGELVLKPIKTNNTNWEKKQDYIASHSETGHHHIVMGMSQIFADKAANVIMRLEADAKIVHKKSFDQHETLLVPAGDYELINKQEYDPFADVMRQIWD